MIDKDAEVLQIELPHDGQLAGFLSNANEPVTSIQCIRPRSNYRFMMIPAFGEACAESVDLPLFLEHKKLTDGLVRCVNPFLQCF
jgi:hypothetical protein